MERCHVNESLLIQYLIVRARVLAASFRDDGGFMFDLGPHISYTKDPRIQQLLADSVDQNYETLQINLNNS